MTWKSKIRLILRWFLNTSVVKNPLVFLNSTFFQTLAVIFVGILAYQVGIKQTELSVQLTKITYSPRFSEPLKFSTFESDMRIENTSKVSLHNLDFRFIDVYNAPNTIRLTGDTTTMVYDLDPGATAIVPVPDDLKAVGKTLSVQVCYSFNDNPLDRVEGGINPIKLNEDPFYEANRRFQAYNEYKCSSIPIKYNNLRLPVII